jgi:hypothetical protein
LFSTALVSAETKIYDHLGKVSKLLILADEGKETISRDIYGHFSEHLGRCVYDGFWVGPDSPIPNIHGIRKDVVEALRKLDIPVLRQSVNQLPIEQWLQK